MSTIRFTPTMLVPFLALIVRGTGAIGGHDLRHATFTGDVTEIRAWLDQSGAGDMARAYQRDNAKAWRANYPDLASGKTITPEGHFTRGVGRSTQPPKFTDADLRELVKLVVDRATDWRPIARGGVLLRYNLNGIGGRDALRFCAMVVEAGIYALTDGV